MKRFGSLFAFFAALVTTSFLFTGCEIGGGGSGGGTDNEGDRAKIIGTWRVNTTWRWSQMTFNADGSRSVVDRVSGATFHRGSWRLSGGKLIVVSDVTEEWDYVVTDTTLTATLPGGSVVPMSRIN